MSVSKVVLEMLVSLKFENLSNTLFFGIEPTHSVDERNMNQQSHWVSGLGSGSSAQQT